MLGPGADPTMSVSRPNSPGAPEQEGDAASRERTAEGSFAPPARALIARNAGFLMVGQVVTMALSIVVSALLGRFLGASDFGTLYLINSTISFAYVFVEWGQLGYLVGMI